MHVEAAELKEDMYTTEMFNAFEMAKKEKARFVLRVARDRLLRSIGICKLLVVHWCHAERRCHPNAAAIRSFCPVPFRFFIPCRSVPFRLW